MTLILLLVFIIPIALLISSVLDNSGPVIAWLSSGHIQIPKLEWLSNIPYIGSKLAVYYQKMIAGVAVRSSPASSPISVVPPAFLSPRRATLAG